MYTTLPPEQLPSSSPTSDSSQNEEARVQAPSSDNFVEPAKIEEETKPGSRGLEAEPAQPTMDVPEHDLDNNSFTPGEIQTGKHAGAWKVKDTVQESTEAYNSAPPGPARQVSPSPKLPFLLVCLFERTLQHGLLPKITAEPTAFEIKGATPGWEVTISLHELAISASGHGPDRRLAETAAALNFERKLSNSETLAELRKFPRTVITRENATEIIQAYCHLISVLYDIRKDVTRTAFDTYESRIFAGNKQIGGSAVSAVVQSAKRINTLGVAHSIIKGHPDVWPAGLEDPFQAKIVVDGHRWETLQALIKEAEEFLTNNSQGPNYKAHHNLTEPGKRQVPDFDSLRSMPFPSSVTEMLILGASSRCLEPAIILAALGRHAIYQRSAHVSKTHSEHFRLDPGLKNTMFGDHSNLVLLFQALRSYDPDSVTKDGLTVAERFDHYDPSGIRAVDAAARNIEQILTSAGLVRNPGPKSNTEISGTELQVRAQPFGGRLNLNSTRMDIVRHLLVLGFGHNIARYGYGTLIPGAAPELRVGSQKVHIESLSRAPMHARQLKKKLENGPLVVLSGIAQREEGHGLTVRYSTPISTWQAVLFGEDLSLTKETGSPSLLDETHLVLNGWLPVLIRSQAYGVSDEQVRDLIIETRDVLHRAIRKANLDFVQKSWTSIEFYELLKKVPNEVAMEAKKNNVAQGGKEDTAEDAKDDTIKGKRRRGKRRSSSRGKGEDIAKG